MRYDTTLSFATDLFQKHKNNIQLTTNKKGVTLYDKPVRTWSALSDFLPPSSDISFSRHCPLALAEIKKHLMDLCSEAKKTELDTDFADTKILEDVLTGQMYLIENGGIQPFNFPSWKKSIPEEQYELLYIDRIHGVAAFDPTKPLSWDGEVVATTGPQEFPHYNTYIKPFWHYNDDPGDYPLSEEFVRPFLEVFLPIEDQRKYVLHWLATLAYARNQDVLVLIGMQGNGKNTLMQIASIIAGEHNSMTGSKAFGRDKFNGEVLKRKLVNLDEYSIKGNAKESLKCFSNDEVTIEQKGGEPVQITNHCSFIVANNSMRSTDFEFKDRRFTCPELAKKDLLMVWSKDRIAAFKAAMKTKEFKIEFPYWLQKEVSRLGINYPNQMNMITDHFYNIVEAAKPEWFKEFKRQLKYKKMVNTQDIYKATRLRVSDARLQEELAKEIEEREYRKIKIPVLATIETTEGKTQYHSNIYEGDKDVD